MYRDSGPRIDLSELEIELCYLEDFITVNQGTSFNSGDNLDVLSECYFELFMIVKLVLHIIVQDF